VNILVVAAHPDDEVLGCGGVMARHNADGDNLHVVVMTRGVESLFAAELTERVRREAEQAHKLLGVKSTHYLDFPAPMLDTVPAHKLADALQKVVRKHRAQVVYVPHWGDIHMDHQCTHRAALVACRMITGSPVERVLSYETVSETEWASVAAAESFTPNVFVDIQKHLKTKLKAMACYRSQLQEPPHPRSLKNLEALATVRGATAGFYAAEAFQLVWERTPAGSKRR